MFIEKLKIRALTFIVELFKLYTGVSKSRDEVGHPLPHRFSDGTFYVSSNLNYIIYILHSAGSSVSSAICK